MSSPVSLLVPVYNEAENFPALVENIEKSIPEPRVMYVVYDFDEDTTVPVARRLAESRPWIRLLPNGLGRGFVNALRAGFRAVKNGPAIVIMADLSDDLPRVPRMLELYREGHLIVCPSRYMRGGSQTGGPWLKRTLSRLGGLSLRWFIGFPTHDATNNFRLYDAGFVNSIEIESTGSFEVAFEITVKAFRRGVAIAEVPASWRDRTAGKSRFRLWRLMPKYLRWYMYAVASRFLLLFRKPAYRKDPDE
jgi:dolichol-phosphate mannosyltransferase